MSKDGTCAHHEQHVERRGSDNGADADVGAVHGSDQRDEQLRRRAACRHEGRTRDGGRDLEALNHHVECGHKVLVARDRDHKEHVEDADDVQHDTAALQLFHREQFTHWRFGGRPSCHREYFAHRLFGERFLCCREHVLDRQFGERLQLSFGLLAHRAAASLELGVRPARSDREHHAVYGEQRSERKHLRRELDAQAERSAPQRVFFLVVEHRDGVHASSPSASLGQPRFWICARAPADASNVKTSQVNHERPLHPPPSNCK